MALASQIQTDTISALKSGDTEKVTTLRMLSAAIKNEQIAKRVELSGDQISAVIQRLIKQRHEAARLYQKAGRNSQARQEEREIIILQHYLPKQLARSELMVIINETIAELPDHSRHDFGNVMKEVMAKVKGRVPGNLVSDLVKQSLSQ